MTNFDSVSIAKEFNKTPVKKQRVILKSIHQTAHRLSARGKALIADQMIWTAAYLSTKAAEDNAPRCKYPFDDGRWGVWPVEHDRVKAAEDNAPRCFHPHNDGRQTIGLNLGDKPGVGG